jgi:hypothetical protein
MIYKRYFFANEELGNKIINTAAYAGLKFRVLSVGSKGTKASYQLRFNSKIHYLIFNQVVRLFLRGELN